MELDKFNVMVKNFRDTNKKYITILETGLKDIAIAEGENIANVVNSQLRGYFVWANKNLVTVSGVKKAIEVAGGVDNPNNFAALVQGILNKPWLRNKYLDSSAYNTLPENTESAVNNDFDEVGDFEVIQPQTKANKAVKKVTKKTKTKKSKQQRVEGLVTMSVKNKIKQIATLRGEKQCDVVADLIKAGLVVEALGAK